MIPSFTFQPDPFNNSLPDNTADVTFLFWNVNSIRRREHGLASLISRYRPHVIGIAETKCANDRFPEHPSFTPYHVAMHGQRQYNGVALFSIPPISDPNHCPPSLPSNGEARYIDGVTVHGIRVVVAYVPQGFHPAAERFQRKISFLENLHARLQSLLLVPDVPIAVMADINIAATDSDVYSPSAFKDGIWVTEIERRWYQRILSLGFVDVGALPPTSFTCWEDDRHFRRDEGARVDIFFISHHFKASHGSYTVDTQSMQTQTFDRLPTASDSSTKTIVKPSDHAPIILTLRLPLSDITPIPSIANTGLGVATNPNLEILRARKTKGNQYQKKAKAGVRQSSLR